MSLQAERQQLRWGEIKSGELVRLGHCLQNKNDTGEIDEADCENVSRMLLPQHAHEARALPPTLCQRLLGRPVFPARVEGEDKNGMAENGGRNEGDGEDSCSGCEVADVK
jgi:hypothetical protein